MPAYGVNVIDLVLLPGLDGTGEMFAPFVEALGARARATVVRYPIDEALGYQALRERVDAALPRGRPFVLVGESFSGPLALFAAANRPAELALVVLVATFVQCPVRWAGPWASAAVGPWAFRRLVPAPLMRRALLAHDSRPELLQAVIAATKQVHPHVMASRIRAVLEVDARAALRACATKIVYLRATRDRLIGAHASRRIQELRPDVEVVDVDAPHLVLQHAPAECARLVLERLTAV
jgi:pimeloyl-[acyl-carrier protein] methyl ester esterase